MSIILVVLIAILAVAIISCVLDWLEGNYGCLDIEFLILDPFGHIEVVGLKKRNVQQKESRTTHVWALMELYQHCDQATKSRNSRNGQG